MATQPMVKYQGNTVRDVTDANVSRSPGAQMGHSRAAAASDRTQGCQDCHDSAKAAKAAGNTRKGNRFG